MIIICWTAAIYAIVLCNFVSFVLYIYIFITFCSIVPTRTSILLDLLGIIICHFFWIGLHRLYIHFRRNSFYRCRNVRCITKFLMNLRSILIVIWFHFAFFCHCFSSIVGAALTLYEKLKSIISNINMVIICFVFSFISPEYHILIFHFELYGLI